MLVTPLRSPLRGLEMDSTPLQYPLDFLKNSKIASNPLELTHFCRKNIQNNQNGAKYHNFLTKFDNNQVIMIENK